MYKRSNTRILGLVIGLGRGFMCAAQIALSQSLSNELIKVIEGAKTSIAKRSLWTSSSMHFSKNTVSTTPELTHDR